MDVTAVIEDPRGSTLRHHWNATRGEWEARPHSYSSEPWPTSYGYIPGTWNAADRDDLDILVLARKPLETGSRVHVRAVGLLRRPDGDDKILGVLIGDPEFDQIERLEDAPKSEIESIERWFAAWSEIGEWRDEIAARQRIAEAKRRARE